MLVLDFANATGASALTRVLAQARPCTKPSRWVARQPARVGIVSGENVSNWLGWIAPHRTDQSLPVRAGMGDCFINLTRPPPSRLLSCPEMLESYFPVDRVDFQESRLAYFLTT